MLHGAKPAGTLLEKYIQRETNLAKSQPYYLLEMSLAIYFAQIYIFVQRFDTVLHDILVSNWRDMDLMDEPLSR